VKFLRKQTIIAVHDELIAEHGGLEGIRDENALESALMAPMNLFHYTQGKCHLADLAAKYAYALTKNHPFNDGNKRIALFSCLYFLKINGNSRSFPKDSLFLLMLEISSGRIAEVQFAEWILKNLSDNRLGKSSNIE